MKSEMHNSHPAGPSPTPALCWGGGGGVDIDIEVYWSNPQQVVAITTPRQEKKHVGHGSS